MLAGAVRARTDGQLPNMRAIVGFAAETGDANGDVLFHARAKLQRKGCDLLVVNAVGEGKAFEVDNNDGWLLAADGNEVALEHGSKTLMSSRIVDAIAAFLGQPCGVTRARQQHAARKGCARTHAAAARLGCTGGDIDDMIRITKFRKGMTP